MIRAPASMKVKPGAQKSASTSIPAPIGGLNARDSIASMSPTDASMMENLFPSPTEVTVRNGFQPWSTFTGVCETIMVYNGLTQLKVYPCVKNVSTFSIYDGTSAGGVGSPVVGGGGATVEALTNTRFDYVNFGTAGGQYLFAVNGADAPLKYDGSTWAAAGLTGGTPAHYQSIALYGNRLWTFEKNTFTVHYWPVNTISGASAGDLTMASLFRLGGHLVAMASLSTQSIYGNMVDYIGFISSEGEIAVYTGSDPSSASTWSLEAMVRVGRPVTVGNRNWQKWGTDVLLLCTDGVYPLQKAFTQGRKIDQTAVSDKIRPLLSDDIALYGGKYGWQLIVHPTGNKLIVNVPTNEDVTAYQYVMNTQNLSWTKFTGWNSFCFEVAQSTLYMGGVGTMVKADITALDGNVSVTAKCRQAYNYLGARGQAKHTKMMRPLLTSNLDYNLIMTADVDYRPTNPVLYQAVPGGSGDPWGGIWSCAWSGPPVTSLHWYGVDRIGHAIAPYLGLQSNGAQITWSATDVLYEQGGVLA